MVGTRLAAGGSESEIDLIVIFQPPFVTSKLVLTSGDEVEYADSDLLS